MTTEVRDNPAEGRFEIVVDGDVAGYTEYVRRDGKTVFTHTEVSDAYEGRGLASELVKGALDEVRGWDESVVPDCAYVRGWIDKHPEYKELLER